MTDRDERRARLMKWASAGGYVRTELRAELEASDRDRKALAEARELLGNGNERGPSVTLFRDIADFLKRTDPTDE